MGGDTLTLLLTFAGFSVAAALGAIAVNGVRARILWACSLLFAIVTLAFLQAQNKEPVRQVFLLLWGLSPVIGMSMFWIVLSGRTEKKLPPKPSAPIPPPILNPALTASYLNDLVRGKTQLEAKRKLAGHSGQLAKMTGEVVQIRDWPGNAIRVSVLGLVERHGRPDDIALNFRGDQADSLEVIKPGDWIEFSGLVRHDDQHGWTLVECEFIGRASPPPKPRAPRKKPETNA